MPSLSASHSFGSSLRKCKNFFSNNNMKYEWEDEKDKLSVSISGDQTYDFAPGYRKNYSEIKDGFENWKEYKNVEPWYGFGSWGIRFKRSRKLLLDFHGYHGLERFHRIYWYDKKGTKWYSYGVLGIPESQKFPLDNHAWSEGCKLLSNGKYTDKVTQLYYGYVPELKKHFAAIIYWRSYYKVLSPDF